MSSRQGSASFTIVIGGLTALVTGAIVLTFIVYPIINAFMGAAFWGSAETTAGARVFTYTGGLWTFWGGVILIAILSWVWIQTRQ
jgi:hypothetical protein